MPIGEGFQFAHEIHAASARSGDLLGLLRGLVGAHPHGQPQRTWKGKGFNMLFRPNFGGLSGPKDFFLELNYTDETLEFTDITGTGVANRGFLQKDITLGAIAYQQKISDSFDATPQHFEPGVWANVQATTNPAELASVTRMGSIPHGTTVNLQGQAFSAQQPRFEVLSSVPFHIGQPAALQDFPDRTLANPSQSRTSLARVAGLDQPHLNDPNKFLSDAVAGETILGTTVLVVQSDTSAPGDVPNAGGGDANIAFLTGVGAPPAGGPNAVAAFTKSTFWIERVKGRQGKPDYDQLQYSQLVLLNFNGLSWPHITVATLREA